MFGKVPMRRFFEWQDSSYNRCGKNRKVNIEKAKAFNMNIIGIKKL